MSVKPMPGQSASALAGRADRRREGGLDTARLAGVLAHNARIMNARPVSSQQNNAINAVAVAFPQWGCRRGQCIAGLQCFH